MAKIFISRKLNDFSWQSQMLKKGHQLVCESLIKIEKVAFDKPESDWIFFYSKNGVRHFFEQTQAMLAPYRWACIGPQTAHVLHTYVLDIDFIGDGDPANTAKAFDQVVAPHEVVCYCRAANSMKSVQQSSTHPNIIDLVVYNNSPSEAVPSEKFDILVFTSPMNVKAYFKNNSYQGEQLIAIGTTTAAYLKGVCEADISICANPSEKELLSLVKAVADPS